MRRSWLLAFCSTAALLALLVGWSNVDRQDILEETNKNDSVHQESSALHHLSSSSLVQRAAADCASDPHCVPSVDELVQRAAEACAKDPACVCDWGRYPRKCFLSEVQRHKQLVKDAKALEAVLREREEVKTEKVQLAQRLDRDEDEFAQEVSKGVNAVRNRQLQAAKHDLTQAEYFHQLSERLSGTRHPRQLRDLHGLAKDIVSLERGTSMSGNDHDDSRHLRKSDGGNGRGEARPVASNHELTSLKKEVKMLVDEVASIANRNSQKETLAPAPIHRYSTRTQIRSLAHEVAGLTGKLSELEHSREWEHSSPVAVQSRPRKLSIARTQDLAEVSDDSSSDHSHASEQAEQIERERAKVLSHQEMTFADSLAQGHSAVARGDLGAARTALTEAKYYNQAIGKLRGLPSSECSECHALAMSISRAELQQSRTQELEERERSHVSREIAGVKRDEAAFDRTLRRGEEDLIGHRELAARSALGRARGLLTRVEEKAQVQPHSSLILHEMREAVEGLAGRIDEAGGSQPGERKRDDDEANREEAAPHREHDEHNWRKSRGRTVAQVSQAHANNKYAHVGVAKGHERARPSELHVLSEQLDGDIRGGESALKQGDLKLAMAKLAAATRLRQKVLSHAGVDFEQAAIPRQLHQLREQIAERMHPARRFVERGDDKRVFERERDDERREHEGHSSRHEARSSRWHEPSERVMQRVEDVPIGKDVLRRIEKHFRGHKSDVTKRHAKEEKRRLKQKKFHGSA